MKNQPKPRSNGMPAFCFALLLCSVALNVALLNGELVTKSNVNALASSMSDKDYVTALVELER